MPVPGKRLEYRDDLELGLIFRVTDKGVRSWSVRYRNAAGEQRRKGLGKYPSMGLARARNEARKAKGAVASGSDPVAQDKAAKVQERRRKLHTLSGLAEAYFTAATEGIHRGGNIARPKRPGTIAEELRVYNKQVMPKFGEHPVASITRQEISDFVSKQAQKAKSNGRHCRNILRQIMNFGVREGTIERNPALDIAVAMPVARARILSELRD